MEPDDPPLTAAEAAKQWLGKLEIEVTKNTPPTLNVYPHTNEMKTYTVIKTGGGNCVHWVAGDQILASPHDPVVQNALALGQLIEVAEPIKAITSQIVMKDSMISAATLNSGTLSAASTKHLAKQSDIDALNAKVDALMMKKTHADLSDTIGKSLGKVVNTLIIDKLKALGMLPLHDAWIMALDNSQIDVFNDVLDEVPDGIDLPNGMIIGLFMLPKQMRVRVYFKMCDGRLISYIGYAHLALAWAMDKLIV